MDVDQIQSWTIGILSYNESATIKKVCIEALRVLKTLPEDKKEVLIVDDCSNQVTLDVLKELEKLENVRIIYHQKNLGMASAEKTIYNNSFCENIYIISGDDEVNINEIESIPNLILEKDTFVLFYRSSKGGYTLKRHFFSLMNKLINFLLFGKMIKDVNWNKVIKKSYVGDLNLECNSALIESEIVFKLLSLNKQIIEIPSFSKPRKFGKSSGNSYVTLKKAFCELFNLWKIIYNYRNETNRVQ